MRILIADDHVVIRAQVRCLLEAEHWEVCGEAAALEKVRQLKPDLVILDMNMPVLSGYDVALEIRRVSPLTRILILSMYEQANLPSILEETKADAYVTKSRTISDLISTIKELLSTVSTAVAAN